MQRNAMLGMSLGKLLSDAIGGTGKQQGVLDGMKANQIGADIAYKNAMIDKANIEASGKQQEIAARSDEGLAKSLVAGMQNGINGDNVKNDFTNYLAGNYKPREQQGPALPPGSYMPAPEYVSKFPELQQKFSGLKQMLALGDKNLPNLAKSIQGDQRNALTKNITPDNAADIGLQVSALEGNVNPLEMVKASIARGLSQGSDPKAKENALLLSQGKTRFDNMGGTGTFDLLTGLQSLNELGQSGVIENKAQANYNNAGANERRTQSDLNKARTDGVKAGKGDGSTAFKVDSSYQHALGTPAIDEKGKPVIDMFTGRQIVNRNMAEEENFIKWASDNKYPSTDAAIGNYIAQGRPRANTAKPAVTAPNNNKKQAPSLKQKNSNQSKPKISNW